jgi:EmrB/QacA subfamily drug resistance transporter
MNAAPSEPRRWAALGVCLVVGFMVLLDVSIVNVALPAIGQGLGADVSDLQWIVSGYALAFGLLLVPAGRVADLVGRREVLVTGIALFTVASVACGLAASPTWLVVARLVQGVGGGLITPQIAGIIQSLFRGPARGRAFGLFGATVGVSTAVGPLLGGLLITGFGAESGWRAIFLVNVPVGVVAALLAWRLVPRNGRAGGRRDFDPVGVALLGLGTLLVLLPFVESQEWGAWRWWLLVPAAALLGGFVAWERSYRARGQEPMVDLALFRRRSFSFGSLIALTFFAGFTAIFFVHAQFLQNGFGYSALAAGLAITPYAIGSAITSAIGGRLVTRTGRSLVAGGLLLVVIGIVAAWWVVDRVDAEDAGWALAGPLLVAGLGTGFVISPNLTLTVSEVPVEQGSTAGGLVQTGQRVGSAVGIAAVGAVFYGALAATNGDYTQATADAFLLISVLLAVALAVAAADLVTNRVVERRAADRVDADGVGV